MVIQSFENRWVVDISGEIFQILINRLKNLLKMVENPERMSLCMSTESIEFLVVVQR